MSGSRSRPKESTVDTSDTPGTSSKSMIDKLADPVRDMPRSGIRDFFDIVSQMKEVISLSIGEPDFVTPWHIREHTIFALEQGRTGYTGNRGLPQLLKALSGYVEKTFDLSYNPDTEILTTVGVSEALDVALRALINPGDEIIYHEPCYVSYAPIINMAHGKAVCIETLEKDNFCITPEQLSTAITPKTKAVVINFPNNPTGGSMDADTARALAEIVVANDLIVITDEVYAELTYEGTHTSIATMPGMRERTIFLHGFSKAWAMTGFRIGYACAPPELCEAMMKIHQYTMLCAPILSQEAAIEALKQPEVDIAEMRASYLRRRNFITNAFADMGVPCMMPQGAFYAFPNISQFGMSSKDFALRFLDEQEVALVPGTAFGACGEGFVRCSYATAMDDIQIAMERMAIFCDSLKTKE